MGPEADAAHAAAGGAVDAARARWQKVEALVDAALDLPAEAREAFLRHACGDDATLRREVLRILEAGEAPDPLVDTPIAALAVALISATEEVDDAPPAAALPERIGPYRVVSELGQGGMGTVYLAERDDGEFRQTVALKLVRRGLHHDPRILRRFREERQILASLQHPDIARLLDGGLTDDGLPYFAMEYVEGEAIDRYCDARRLSIEQRLALFVRVCDAVAHAHRQGIVHRDLKPSNILVTRPAHPAHPARSDGAAAAPPAEVGAPAPGSRESTGADPGAAGTPKLLDFGIAKLTAPQGDDDAPGGLTRTGERLLTPEYASPEQIRGEAITAATDVYALGVLLYELLTGQRPFRRTGRSPHDIERAVLDEEPTRPSTAVTRSPAGEAAGAGTATTLERASATRRSTPLRLKQRLRGDLDAIVLQALRKEPERRYATAAELGADVQRHLAGRAVLARGDSAAYRARTWARRHRRTVAAAVVGMAVGVAAIAGFASRESRQIEEWMEAQGLTDSVSTRSPLARRYYEDGLRAFAMGELADAVRLFRAALAADSTFAMAAFYGSNAAQLNEDYRTARELLEHSVRHAGSASERERLIVRAHHAAETRQPTLRTYADSLNTRFPSTALGALWSARAALLAGDWTRAVAEARRAVALDSLSIRENLVPCHACEGLLQIANAYVWADSLEAAERAAGVAVQRMPRSAAAWRSLAYAQLLRGAPTDSAYRRAIALDPADVDYAVEWLADARLRGGDFAAADEMLRSRVQTAPPPRVERSLGLLIASLRMQERWAEALELARQYRALPEPDTGIVMAPLLAQVLLESGRPREAAALFDTISRSRPGWPARASYRSWHLAHRAGALAAAGDTAELAAIADTIRALAPSSGNGRDALLPHYVDGLLLAARGDDAAAVEAFRRAVFSWNRGYTRVNHELARALLRLGRPREAVDVLQPALRGSLEVNNSYITHTALRRLLAEAWRAAGEPDSAAAHAAWVTRATAR